MTNEKHLRVFEDRSEYHIEESIETFAEGVLTTDAKVRLKSLKDTFKSGFLDDTIEELISGASNIDSNNISDAATASLNALVDSLTSEVANRKVYLLDF